MLEFRSAPFEAKFTDVDAGTFSGIASAFDTIDAHGDLVVKGAFAASLAEHKAKGTMPVLYVEHGPAFGGDPLPSGVWTKMEEADEGLIAEGRILALDTDHGKRVRSLMRDGAMGDLSIGYSVAPGGASYSKDKDKPGPRRILRTVRLHEVSVVTRGSNPRAKITSVKSAAIFDRVEEMKARFAAGDLPTEREMEHFLRDVGVSRSVSTAMIAGCAWKTLRQRDAAGSEASKAAVEAAQKMRHALDGFSLPSF